MLKPGVIPLRPLTLGDIFNGAVGYIRANPAATLGLTAAVVVIMQTIALILRLGPLVVTGVLGTMRGEQVPAPANAGSTVPLLVGAVASGLIGILLSGMLTVVVGRAVFGSTITVGDAWTRIRGRLAALIGLAALEAVGAVLLVGLVALFIAAVAAIGNGALTLVFGLPVALAGVAALVYLYTVLAFAPVLIVLERLTVVDAITRSITLVQRSFWRVLGIRLLTAIVVIVVAEAVALPFSIVGQVLLTAGSTTGTSAGPLLIGATLGAIGSAVGQIITAPFSAGVVVLLYTDRRIRAEAFDLVLQSGAAAARSAAASTDELWLARPVGIGW